jgi:hypothetical protein
LNNIERKLPAVSPGRQRRQLADQPARLQPARFEVHDFLGVGIKRRHRADRSHQHPHRMSVVAEALHEGLEILMHHRVSLDVLFPGAEMMRVGQLALDHQVGDLEVVAVLGQVFDRIAAVAQDAFFAVDEGHLAPARSGVGEGRIIRHQAKILGAGLDVAEPGGADHAALLDRNLVLFSGAVVGHGERVVSHGPFLPSRETSLRSAVLPDRPFKTSPRINIYTVKRPSAAAAAHRGRRARAALCGWRRPPLRGTLSDYESHLHLPIAHRHYRIR